MGKKSKVYIKYLLKPLISHLGSDDFKNYVKKVFIIWGLTGQGKSKLQDTDIRPELEKRGTKVIIRVAPDKAVRDDGVFVTEETGWKNITHYANDGLGGENIGMYRKNARDTILQLIEFSQSKITLNLTWQTFSTWKKELVQALEEKGWMNQSVLLVEEVHQMIGVGVSDEDGLSDLVDKDGNPISKATTASKEVYASNTPSYKGTHYKSTEYFMEHGGRVIAFTATCTRHQKGELESFPEFNDRFATVNSLPPLDEMMPHQSWYGDIIPFKLQNDTSNNVESTEAIEALFKIEDLRQQRTERLKEIKQKYPHAMIDSKLVSVIYTGIDKDDIDWQSSISLRKHRAMAKLNEKLIADGFDPHTPYHIVCNGKERKRYDLLGNQKGLPFKSDQEVFAELENPHKPACFLWLKNKGSSGINVHNIASETFLRCRTSHDVRTERPIQMFGRGVRVNPGMAKDFFFNKCNYSIIDFLDSAPAEYNVPSKIVAEVLVLANSVDYAYPSNPNVIDSWGYAWDVFKTDYMNSCEDARVLLESLIDDICYCPTCNQVLPKNFVLPKETEINCNRFVLN